MNTVTAPGRKTLFLLLLGFAASLAAPGVQAAACNDGIDNDGDGHTDYPADPGCFAAEDNGEANPASALVGGVYMPSLQDERDTYGDWGWTYTASDEPNYDSAPGYYVDNFDVHYDSEADDLWTYVMMFMRTGQRGYLDRARAWARYFKEDYRACVGDPSFTLCSDHDRFGLDHLYGWGLIAWYEYTGDTAALAEAEALGALMENYWSTRDGGSWPTAGQWSMFTANARRGGRHLLFATRLAEATNSQRWIALRDRLLDLIMQSPDWSSRGMYFASEQQTDNKFAAGAYASGVRAMAAFHVGILAESLYHAYRVTGRADVRDRIVAMAQFVDRYGMDPNYEYTGSWFGVNINTGEPVHNYSYGGTPTFWDPVYGTSLANVLVMGAKYTGEGRLYNRAKEFFNRSSKAKARGGQMPTREAADDEVHHFVDSVFASATQNFFLAYNKGELKYTYLLFDPASRGPIDMVPPKAPANLIVE